MSYYERAGDGGGNPNSPLYELNPSESIGLNLMWMILNRKNEVRQAENYSISNRFMILPTRFNF